MIYCTFTPPRNDAVPESIEARHDRTPAGKVGTLPLENCGYICRYFVPIFDVTLTGPQSRRPQGYLHEKGQSLLGFSTTRTALVFIGAKGIRHISGYHHTAPIKQAFDSIIVRFKDIAYRWHKRLCGLTLRLKHFFSAPL